MNKVFFFYNIHLRLNATNAFEQQGAESEMIERVGFILICTLLVFAPLARGAVHLWAQTVIQLGVLAGYLVMLASPGALAKGSWIEKQLIAPLASLVVLCGMSAATSAFPGIALEGCLWFFTYVLLFYAAQAFIQTRKQQRIILWVIMSNTLLISVLAYLTSADTTLPMWIFEGVANEGGFFSGTYRNHNHFAGLLEMSILLFLGIWTTRGHSFEKNVLAGGLVVFLITTLVFTNSRGGWISMGAGLCFLATGLAKKRFSRRAMQWVIVLTLISAILSLVSPSVLERAATLLEGRQIIGFRLAVWDACLEMIRRFPLAGSGPGTFAQAFVAHSPPGMSVLPVYAHNDYLQFTCETGLAFPLLACWLACAFFKDMLYRLNNTTSRQTRGIALGGMASVFALLVHGLVDFNLHIPANALTFTVIAAMAVSPAGRCKKSAASQSVLRGPKPEKKLPVIARCLLGLFLLGLMAYSGVLCLSRFQYQKGIALFEKEAYEDALDYLADAEKVLGILPGKIYGQDRFRIWYARGKTCYNMAKSLEGPLESYTWLKKGAIALRLAVDRAPLNYMSMFWAARTEGGLERLWPSVMGRHAPNPYDALPLYREAAFLRPNGITVHYELARHLFRKRELDKLPELAREISRKYPAALFHLEKEPFYSPAIRDGIKLGLQDALKDKATRRDAYFSLSRMAFEDKDYDSAAIFHANALQHNKRLNTYDHYFHMSRIFLKQKNVDEAIKAAVTAASMSNNFEDTLNYLLELFKMEQQLKSYLDFLNALEQRMYPSKYIDLAKAACLVASEQYNLAESLLTQLNENEPEAKAYNLLAKIAEIRKDWDGMEINSQHATALDPEESMYWIRFSQSLVHNQKPDRAEMAVSKAISLSKEEKAWYFLLRAEIRIQNKKYQDSLTDLLKVKEVNPGWHRTYYLLARVYQGLGDKRKSIFFIQKAIGLAPQEKQYYWFNKSLCK